MTKLLVVVDMQNDFVDGALGSKEAEAIVPKVVEKIKNWDGDIIATYDTHYKNYLKTREGRLLPVEHCILGTEGHELNPDVKEALTKNKLLIGIKKFTFGDTKLPHFIGSALCCNYDYIEFIGLCTDICVVSNALIVKAAYPEVDIAVDASCCAGVTPEKHKAALMTMDSCQITILNAED